MTTQLAIDLPPAAPLQSEPKVTEPQTCPNRNRCLVGLNGNYRCGFEIAGTVYACPKRRGMES